MNPAWVTAVISLATVFVVVVAWVSRMAWRWFSRVGDFLEDWNGRKEDRGHKRIPGVMERLSKLEESAAQQNQMAIDNASRINGQDIVLRDIKRELTINGGGSVKDTVVKILNKVNNPNP